VELGVSERRFVTFFVDVPAPELASSAREGAEELV
jgi:hypothetical protein